MKLSDLPRELEEEILCRVPVKSLRRLRSTGKRWYRHGLFKDPRFIKRHSDKTAARQYHEPIVLVGFRIQSMSSYVDRGRSVSQRFSLTDPLCNLEVDITQAFHCDGVLLCTTTEDKRFVAWDPFSGRTRWIQPRNHHTTSSEFYALGYDNKELFRSYKMLRFLDQHCQTMEIYEFKSDSWRNLDASPGGSFESLGVSLKGNAYWISKRRGAEEEYSLLEFDFSTERFRNLHLAFHEAECLGPCALREGLNGLALSVVGEERLYLLYDSAAKSKTEIWVSSEIGETTVVSWSKYLTVSSKPRFSRHVSFFVDEDQKLASCFYNNGHICNVAVFGDIAAKKQILLPNGYKYSGWFPQTKCGPIVFGYLPKLV